MTKCCFSLNWADSFIYSAVSWLLFLTCRLLPFIQSHRLWFLFIRLRLLRQLYLTVRSTTEIKLWLQKSKVSSSCFVTFKGWRIFSVWNHTTSARNLLTWLQVEVVWFTGQTEGEKNGLRVFWLTWFTTALCNTWERCTGSATAKCTVSCFWWEMLNLIVFLLKSHLILNCSQVWLLKDPPVTCCEL